MVLSVHHREEHDHFGPLIDDLAHAGLDEILRGWRDAGFLAVQNGQRRPALPIEEIV